MKLELAAGALLLLLMAGAWWNIRAVDTLTGDILAGLDISQAAEEQGDHLTAQAALAKALNRWLEADSYTHIFIRHAEIDSTADAFYELQAQLLAGEGDSSAAFDKLRYHLDSIQRMEHPSLGSIL